MARWTDANTTEELHAAATEAELEGRASLDKAGLIQALNDAGIPASRESASAEVDGRTMEDVAEDAYLRNQQEHADR